MRLIAVDLDGTLLRSDRTLSARTVAALALARERGWHVVPVSARPPRFLRALASQHDIFDFAICCNGALIYDIVAGTLLEHAALDPAEAREIAAQLRARLPGVCFAAEMGLRYGWDAAYAGMPGALLDPDGVTAEIDLLVCEPVTKLIVRHPEFPFERLLDGALGLGLSGCEITHSTTDFLEISRRGVDKAAALIQTVARLGLSSADVIAFGDMPNDLPMLRWASHSVAVANAHPEVLATADAVTASNDDDGVAAVLEQLLELPKPLPSR